jgi:hypothetical protein
MVREQGMDSGVWFMIIVVFVVIYLVMRERDTAVEQVESEGDPIYVDVDEQEYRVRFVVKRRSEKLMAGWISGDNDMVVMSVDARTPTGWRHVGEHTDRFGVGTYGQYDQNKHTYGRETREAMAREAVRHALLYPRR